LLDSRTTADDVGRIAVLVPGELDVTDEDCRGEASKTSRTRSASLRDLMELKLLV
jgi:hypothetical protein